MQSDLEKDKEVESLLKESEALRAEAMIHLEAQYQLTNWALLLLGGLVTVITTLLLVSNNTGLHLTNPNLYFTILLLIASPLFSSLFHAFLSHQLDLGYIGKYINHVTRVRICELLEIEKSSQFFSWDRYHQQQLTSGRFEWFVAAIITTSHLGVVGILSFLTLLAALLAYIAGFSSFTGYGTRWSLLSFLILDAFYLFASIPVGRNAIDTFRQIS